MNQPCRSCGRGARFQSISAWGRELGFDRSTLRDHFRRGRLGFIPQGPKGGQKRYDRRDVESLMAALKESGAALLVSTGARRRQAVAYAGVA